MKEKKQTKKSTKKEKKKKEENMTLRDALSSIRGKKRVALAFFAAFVFCSLVLLFLFTLIDVVTPENMSEKEFLSLLGKIETMEWTVKKGDADKISALLYSFSPDSALTEAEGTTLLLTLYDESMSYTLRFQYIDGNVEGLIGQRRFTLYHSSGKKERNRVLSLVSKEEKITLYEE